MALELVIMSTERTRPATFRWGLCMPTHKIEIVFITIVNRVAVTTQRVFRPYSTPARTKLSQVLLARQPAAVTNVKKNENAFQ